MIQSAPSKAPALTKVAPGEPTERESDGDPQRPQNSRVTSPLISFTVHDESLRSWIVTAVINADEPAIDALPRVTGVKLLRQSTNRPVGFVVEVDRPWRSVWLDTEVDEERK